MPHDRYEPTIREALQVLARQPGPNFPPGSKFEYSNAGYAVLAAVIERASRKSYAEFLKEHIFHPAKMDNTVVYDERKPHIPKPAISYAREGTGFRDIDYTPLNLIVGDEGVFSNIDDMFRWEEALFGGRIVPQRVLDEAFRPATLPGGGQTTYGFGWGLGDSNGHPRISHGGAWVGFHTDISRSVRTPFTQQRPEDFLDDLSNSGPAIRLCDEGKATGARPKTVTGEVMTQYLVAVHHCPFHTISRATLNFIQ